MKKVYKGVLWFAGAIMMAWLGNYCYDQTKEIPVLKYITGALSWLFNAGSSILNYPIKLWIILVVLVGLFMLYRWLKFSTKDELPDFIRYKKDVFKRWIWRWDWERTGNFWTPTNLTPYCPKDDVQLINNGDFFRANYYCPKCNGKYGYYGDAIETAKEAEVLLLDKVDKKTYTKD
jgi:hypothetical protein